MSANATFITLTFYGLIDQFPRFLAEQVPESMVVTRAGWVSGAQTVMVILVLGAVLSAVYAVICRRHGYGNYALAGFAAFAIDVPLLCALSRMESFTWVWLVAVAYKIGVSVFYSGSLKNWRNSRAGENAVTA